MTQYGCYVWLEEWRVINLGDNKRQRGNYSRVRYAKDHSDQFQVARWTEFLWGLCAWDFNIVWITMLGKIRAVVIQLSA